MATLPARDFRLVGGATSATQPAQHAFEYEAGVQQQLAELLSQWGSDITSDAARHAAREEVDRLKQEKKARRKSAANASDAAASPASSGEENAQQQKKEKQLFVYNPYRPQGGMGFRGTPMWEALLAELPTSMSDEQRAKVAQIFRIDAAHNAHVDARLAELDAECERAAARLVEKVQSGAQQQ